MCMCVNMNNTKLSYKNYVVGIMEAKEKANTHNIRVITPRALLCLTKMAFNPIPHSKNWRDEIHKSKTYHYRRAYLSLSVSSVPTSFTQRSYCHLKNYCKRSLQQSLTNKNTEIYYSPPETCIKFKKYRYKYFT